MGEPFEIEAAEELAPPKARRLAVIDLESGEVVSDFDPRPALQVLPGGKDGGKKHKGDKRTSETIDHARMLEASAKVSHHAFEAGGASARASLDTMVRAIADRDKTIETRDKTIERMAAEHSTRSSELHASYGAQVTRLLGLVTSVTGASMEKVVADASIRVAEIESHTALETAQRGIELADKVTDAINKFATGDVGRMLAARFLPQSVAAAAESGAPGGEAALLRLFGKLLSDPELACVLEMLERTAGEKDWAAIFAWASALGSRAATT